MSWEKQFHGHILHGGSQNPPSKCRMVPTRQQPDTFQWLIRVHFKFLRSGKNLEVSDVLASQIRALVR